MFFILTVLVSYLVEIKLKAFFFWFSIHELFLKVLDTTELLHTSKKGKIQRNKLDKILFNSIILSVQIRNELLDRHM